MIAYQDDTITLHHGDCIEVMRALPDNSIDSIVTDPPYGLGFMGKAWDDLPPGLPWARECLRVLKPGGHLLAFGGSRTWHRLAVAVEDAGFELRDSLAWLYGSGFPKSHDVSKGIDKAAGAERETQGHKVYGDGHVQRSTESIGYGGSDPTRDARSITAPATPEAQQWQGWGTALKPAFEPIVMGRKPFPGTVAGNVLAHGTGALNIDGCRIGDDAGRWPANVMLDESQADALDQQSGVLKGKVGMTQHGSGTNSVYGKFGRSPQSLVQDGVEDIGGASRFFYCSKAPKAERPNVDGVQHPTVKPLAVMRWLLRLVTPPGGITLDTFAGSGATGEAATLEGFKSILIEREAAYLPLIISRAVCPNCGTKDQGMCLL